MNSAKLLATILVNDEPSKNSFSESTIQLLTYHRALQCIHINSLGSEQLKEQITQKKTNDVY